MFQYRRVVHRSPLYETEILGLEWERQTAECPLVRLAVRQHISFVRQEVQLGNPGTCKCKDICIRRYTNN